MDSIFIHSMESRNASELLILELYFLLFWGLETEKIGLEAGNGLPSWKFNDQLFPCDVCGKVFGRQQTLSRHLSLHTGNTFFLNSSVGQFQYFFFIGNKKHSFFKKWNVAWQEWVRTETRVYTLPASPSYSCFPRSTGILSFPYWFVATHTFLLDPNWQTDYDLNLIWACPADQNYNQSFDPCLQFCFGKQGQTIICWLRTIICQ